ncbi:MAG: AAA family ATPase [Pseudomonadota bacterium]
MPLKAIGEIPQCETRRSRFYSAASLKGKAVPPREWLVPDLVPMRTVTLISGDGGTGKSLLALQLAVASASSGDWLRKEVQPGRVIVLSAEDDDDELHRRLGAVLAAVGKTYDDVAGLTMRSLAGEDALLAVESQLSLLQSELFDELEARAADEQPALIVLDTLADVYPSSENDRTKVRQFIGILRGLAIRQRCAVMLLGHPSLTGMASGSGASGSTAWNNSVRSRLYLSRISEDGYEPDPDKRVLTTKKANYGRVGEEILLTWQAGVFEPEPAPSSVEVMTAAAKAERIFLALLDQFTAEERFVSSTPCATYAPTQFAKHPNAEGVRKAAFATAMNNLFGRGEIVNAKHGTGAKARSHLARPGHEGDGQ